MIPLSSTERCRSDQAGFTLVEVLVAVALVSLVLTALYGLFGGLSQTQQHLRDEAALYHQARVLCDRLACELRSVLPPGGDDGSRFSAGFDSRGNPYLQFASLSAVSPGAPAGQAIAVRYALERLDRNDPATLRRYARGLLETRTAERGLRVTSAILALQWRFHDGIDWRDDWDSDRDGGLPQRIELRLSLQQADQPFHLLTAFDLPLAGEQG